MALPTNELFESFLSETKIVKEKPEGPHILLNPHPKETSEAPIIYLSYPEMELKLDSVSLLSKITEN